MCIGTKIYFTNVLIIKITFFLLGIQFLRLEPELQTQATFH